MFSADVSQDAIKYNASAWTTTTAAAARTTTTTTTTTTAPLCGDTATVQRRRATLRCKPPNVVVYCGKKDSGRLFAGIRSALSQCLNTDQYVIYQLKHDQVASTPWQDNTSLLVIASDKVYDNVDREFFQYYTNGGRLLSFGSEFDRLLVKRVVRSPTLGAPFGLLTLRCDDGDRDSCGLSVIATKYCYTAVDSFCESLSGDDDVTVMCLAADSAECHPVIVEAQRRSSASLAILSQVHLEKEPAEFAISPQVFTLLKRSDSARLSLLTSLLIRLGLDCDKPVALPLSPVCLLAASSVRKAEFLSVVNARLQADSQLVSRDVMLRFVDDTAAGSVDVSVDSVGGNPVLTVLTGSRSADQCTFNGDIYRQYLTARLLGNVMLCADVTTTTMHLIDCLMFSCPAEVGLVAVARRQLAGRGRGGNSWLSPDGCAMFSVHVRVPVSSHLGQRISFIQHLMSLAVVLAVRQKPHWQDVDLRIKWPNDIYFGRQVKLGGIIVKSSVMSDVIHVNIGVGVNVANRYPTVCINDLLHRPPLDDDLDSSRSQHPPELDSASHQQPSNDDLDSTSQRPPDLDFSRLHRRPPLDDDFVSSSRSQQHQPHAEPLSVEELIARSLSVLEDLIDKFENEDQRQLILDQYYKHWLHNDAVVRLAREGSEQTVSGRVVGLDQFGFLQVSLAGRDDIISVQPDGNSFDMMRNLILPKS